ncbi:MULTISPECIES: GTPase family protein [unclassified Pseudoalteromonas]|uniref:GTPase family protein n=1 Tax=unclassified Pseudoalteromonas TaxID=194690 RepID=UPI0006DC7D17|nr:MULTISPECIES: GTPase [unclassified Pseudoalteromonas]KPW03421.1 GTPase Era [Pseudoalteromonas sp. P1-11]MDC9566073.1 50S ribosome-binding GTPase [Pseudoalteromonas sp. GAB2316C]MDC9567600.1 50S ribosome-binding GTPase [Pseudoalteromonas sp. GABNB9D]MDC9571702.1 50S ribosome-binding GTPase [Pseudoalteromonas sp. GABNS16A]MDC9576280.1 50S ribosome-binding GTPase [Pseudoalteromonas sp. GABNS16E]
MYKNYRETDFITGLNIIGINPLDIMVTGVTGAGKSTTLNSIFQKDIAKVGKGVDPETMTLTSYMLNDYFRLWDTPGLGDGIEKDREHSKKIVELLYKDYSMSDNKHGFIDMVLVIIEGSNRDMGTNYKLLNEIIVPNFQKERIVVAVNQADMAMKGRYWDYTNNEPMEKLKDFLESQTISIQNRVKEATGVSIIKPIYYSAEYGYNIDVLLDLLVDNMPNQKRNLVLK